MIDGWGISFALRWMSLDLNDDKSTLVRVMAWCRQATSHYLSQCWPRSLLPYGVTRPQWVNPLFFYHGYHLPIFKVNTDKNSDHNVLQTDRQAQNFNSVPILYLPVFRQSEYTPHGIYPPVGVGKGRSFQHFCRLLSQFSLQKKEKESINNSIYASHLWMTNWPCCWVCWH